MRCVKHTLILFLNFALICVLIDKRKPITGMGCLEFIMNQEQTFQLILALIQQGVKNPEEIAEIIKHLSKEVFTQS